MVEMIFLLSLIVFFFSLIFLFIGIRSKSLRYRKNFFPNVSVISWGWKDGNVIERKIKNFLSLDYPGKYEVIIIDNASQDETKRICEKYARKKQIKYYRTPREYDRKAFGLDEAIKKVAKFEILAMTDPDGVCEKDWLTKIVQPFRDEKVGAVIGLTHCGNFYENFFTKLRAVEDEWIYVISPLGTIFHKDVHFICGANYAVRREALKSVGYHGKKTLGEDFELAIKLYNKDWDVKVTDANVWQEEVSNLRAYIRQRLRWQNSTLEIFKFYLQEIFSIIKKRPIGFLLASLSYMISIFSLLSLVFIILGLLFSLKSLILGIISFFFLNLAFVPSMIRFKRKHLLLYVPFFLAVDSFFIIYCQLLLRYLKLRKKKIEWRSLYEGYYHKGSKIILK